MRSSTVPRVSRFCLQKFRPRLLKAGFVAGIVTACLLGSAAEVKAQTIVRVEEDWRIEIDNPAANINLPQLTNVMAPKNNIDGAHCVFELNYRTLPEYRAGSMQLQCWFGEDSVNYRNSPRLELLSHANEIITYTMRMDVGGGSANFEVRDGNSTSWGDFGGNGLLKSSIETGVADLANYSPETSRQFARIGFGSNRVKKFAITQVRYYAAGGVLVSTDTTERVVHQRN
jgi:hypothetical protein